jgi:hypothetical protein
LPNRGPQSEETGAPGLTSTWWGLRANLDYSQQGFHRHLPHSVVAIKPTPDIT